MRSLQADQDGREGSRGDTTLKLPLDSGGRQRTAAREQPIASFWVAAHLRWACLLTVWILFAAGSQARTVALWLFDEQIGIYPSCVLGDAASGEFPLVIGPGGQIRSGKFGNALEPRGRPPVEYPPGLSFTDPAKQGRFGLDRVDGRDDLLSWHNAHFCALMTRGENHLRQEVDFGSPTASALNLGRGDWTIEFWYLPTQAPQRPGVILEIGTGPLGHGPITRLSLNPDGGSFTLRHDPSELHLTIGSDQAALTAGNDRWRHLAFVYDKSEEQLYHYVDGRLQSAPTSCRLAPLPEGDEDYLSIGRDGRWGHRLPGRIDELRISDEPLYQSDFTPPDSFSRLARRDHPPRLKQGPPLLFAGDSEHEVTPLGSRRHLFIDDALIDAREAIEFTVNPPRLEELVIEGGRGLSNHLVVFEDVAGGDGLVRLYGAGPKRSLAVWTSEDGVHFSAPDLGTSYEGKSNVVIRDPVGLGTIFVDPNGPAEERIKYFSGYRGRSMYVYSSPDGYRFTRNETAALPFRGASQSIVFYDDQRQKYVGYHRSDMERTIGGKSSRTSVMTETTDVLRPWPFDPVTQTQQRALAEERRLGRKNPYYIDNGPLTPPGPGVEYPAAFGNRPGLDPPGVDVYVPKCLKYPWAEDAYLAFPVMYFHYHGDGPEARQALGRPELALGSGPLESQLAVSRDGVHWTRRPRPAYVGIGRHGDLDLKKAYMGHGMIRRGDEIWQYYVGSEEYHSPWKKDRSLREAIFRVVQRLDGFVSLDTPYQGGQFTTRPFTFTGNRLALNIDSDAAGFAQIGLLDESGRPYEGYSLDDCVYINGDFVDTEVEWLEKGKDLSELAGKTVRLVYRARGTKLFSMQFTDR